MGKKQTNHDEKLIPQTHIIQSRVNHDFKDAVLGATCELIDNAFGDSAGNARNVLIWATPSLIAFADDGVGVDDINVLFHAGSSVSAKSATDIGNYGQGAKLACCYLGWAMRVVTIRGGVRHEYSVDWEHVMRSGVWPNAYHGSGRPSRDDVLFELPDGTSVRTGTLVIVTKRHKDRSFQPGALASRLAQIYASALASGRNIYLANHYKTKGKAPQLFSARDSYAIYSMDNEMSGSGDVDGKPFTFRCGFVDASCPSTGRGINVYYKHRLVATFSGLPNSAMPSDLRAEVFLGDNWKKSLSVTKTYITNAAHKRGLLEKVEKAIAPLLKVAERRARQARFRALDLEFSVNAGDIFKEINQELSGTYREGQEADKQTGMAGGDNPNHKPGPGPNSKQTKEAVLGGNFDGNDAKRTKSVTVDYRLDDKLGSLQPWRVEFYNNKATVLLNSNIPSVVRAYEAPVQDAAIYTMIATAISTWLTDDIERMRMAMPILTKALESKSKPMDEIRDELIATFIQKAAERPVTERGH